MINLGPENAAEAFEMVEAVKRDLRALETLGKPVVAAVNGAASAAARDRPACHHRIAADVKGSQIGLPEVTLGLLPGGGGVTRTVRMFGIQKAFMEILSQGTRFCRPRPRRPVWSTTSSVPSRSWCPQRRRIKANPESHTQPWDAKGYKMPGGTPASPGLAGILPSFPALLKKQLKGAPMPAPRAILDAAVEGAQVDFDTASRIESRYFTQLVTGQVAKNMIQAFFLTCSTSTRVGHVPTASARPRSPRSASSARA
ncbi:enoyl-CoA hydratase-related protein [Mycolicibacterium sediminis]|uniref:Enoyl-CoA hydratase n=1 Tax=Mycolicibacterium sediminis TaxID=1286180 RepID=A0A7I7QZY3_9MYCO|nr:hypothetical protein MSEDJ_60300 [Mycolicibacterium sediminis]